MYQKLCGGNFLRSTWNWVGGYGPFWAVWASTSSTISHVHAKDPITQSLAYLAIAIASSSLLGLAIDRGGNKLFNLDRQRNQPSNSKEKQFCSRNLHFWSFFYFKFFFKLIDGFGRMWAVRSALSVCYESYTRSPLTEFSSLESDVVYVVIYLICLSVGLGHMFFWLFPRLIDFQRYKESGTRLISPKNEQKKSGINFTTDFTPRFKTPDMTPPKFSTEMTPPKFSENCKSSEFSSEFSAESNISKGPFQSLQNPLMGQGGEMSAPKRKRNRLCFILIWLWSTFFFFTDGFGRVWAQFAVFEAIILFNKHPIAFVPFFVPALFVSFCGGMFVLYEKWQTNFGPSAKKMRYNVLDVPT